MRNTCCCNVVVINISFLRCVFTVIIVNSFPYFVLVAAGNQGVPDDLQKCHTMSKQLQQNQTDINKRLTVYDGQVTNLTQQASFMI